MSAAEPANGLYGALQGLQDAIDAEAGHAAQADHAMAGMGIMLVARQLSERGLIDYARFLREANDLSARAADSTMADNPYFPHIGECYLAQFRCGAYWATDGGRK